MHNTRNKWRATRDMRTLKRLEAIEASVVALKDDDLLDLADIFVAQPQTPLAEIAAAEMAERKITL